MGHIRKRGPHQYQVRYVDPDGIERARTFDRKAPAEAFLAETEHTMRAGSYVDPRAGLVTVKRYAETWRAQQQHRPNTQRNLESNLRLHLYPQLGHRPIGSLVPSDMRAWQAGRLAVLAPATVRSFRSHVSTMFAAAVVDRVIAANPFTGIRVPKIDEDLVVPLTLAQIRTGQSMVPAWYRAVFDLIAGTGLRASEAFGLTVDRLPLLRRELTVDRQLAGRTADGAPIFGPPKTPSSRRIVPLGDVTVSALAAHLAAYGVGRDGLVFHVRDGGAVTRASWGKRWQPARDAMGLPPREGLHQLRHFYASLLIAQGASVKEVQARMGHKSALETLDTYGHLFPDHETNTRTAVDRALRPAVSDGQMTDNGTG